MAVPITLDFDDLSLEALRERRSVKWRMYPPDVLPAFVAEMDFPLAPPVREALLAAVENDDCGYPHPEQLGEAFAGFAAERYGWTVDPGARRARARRRHRASRSCSPCSPSRARRSSSTRPSTARSSRPSTRPGAASSRRRSRSTTTACGSSTSTCSSARSPTAPPPTCSATRTTRPAASTRARSWPRSRELAARHGVIVLADEIHAPLALEGATHVPVPRGRRGRGRARAHAREREQGVEHRRAQGRGGRLGLRGGRRARGQAARRRCRTTRVTSACSRRSRPSSRAGPWLDALLGHLDLNRRRLASLLERELPARRLRDAGGRLPRLARLPRARARRRSRRGVPRARQGRAQLRARGSAPAARASRGSTSARRARCSRRPCAAWPPPSSSPRPRETTTVVLYAACVPPADFAVTSAVSAWPESSDVTA